MTCSCGNKFTAGSTKEEIKVEVCSACHPFYTGTQKFVDSLGRVEKFQAKQKTASSVPIVSKKKKKLQRKIEETKNEAEKPRTIKEMLSKKV